MAKSISDMMEFGKMPLKKAADEMVMKRLPALGGDGGLVAVDKDGNIDTNMVRPGSVLPMMDQNGHQFQGLVREATDEIVVMDFNHPLAGKDLNFSVTIVDVRAATAEELEHGHVHGPGGHHH